MWSVAYHIFSLFLLLYLENYWILFISRLGFYARHFAASHCNWEKPLQLAKKPRFSLSSQNGKTQLAKKLDLFGLNLDISIRNGLTNWLTEHTDEWQRCASKSEDVRVRQKFLKILDFSRNILEPYANTTSDSLHIRQYYSVRGNVDYMSPNCQNVTEYLQNLNYFTKR